MTAALRFVRTLAVFVRTSTLFVWTSAAVYADPVYVCPEPGALPVVLFPGCPAPVAGELLPLGHAQADRDAADTLADYDRKLKTLRAELAAIPPPPSPWLWASVGALAGGLAVYLVIR